MRRFNTKALCLAVSVWSGGVSAASLQHHQLAISTSSGPAQIEALAKAIAEYQADAPQLIQQAINHGAALRVPTHAELLKLREAANADSVASVLGELKPVFQASASQTSSSFVPPVPAVAPMVVAGAAAAAGALALAASSRKTGGLPFCSGVFDAGAINVGIDCVVGTVSPGNFVADAEFRRMNTGIAGQGDNNRTASNVNALNPLIRHGADHAYERGITGANTLIAVVDDGYLTTHQDLAGKNITLSTAAKPSTEVSTDNNHGTHVAGLAAGARNGLGTHGFAYDADLFLATNSVEFPQLIAFTDELVAAGADVWTNSWGYGVDDSWVLLNPNKENEAEAIAVLDWLNANHPTDFGAGLAQVFDPTKTTSVDWYNWRDALLNFQNFGGRSDQGGIILWANSNLGETQIDIDNAAGGTATVPVSDADVVSALPLIFPELQGRWLTVVNATDNETIKSYMLERGVAAGATTDNAIANFANKSADGSIVLVSSRCGAAADFCIAADGVQVASGIATGTTNYDNFTGTSMATPIVAGSVALLRQAFPNLSAKDLTTRLLVTADNSVTGSSDGVTEFVTENGVRLTHGYSLLFGHGFVDLGAALSPIGTLTAVTRSNMARPLNAAASTGGGAISRSVKRAAAGRTFLASDVTNAHFSYRLDDYVGVTASHFANDVVDKHLRQARTHMYKVSNGLTLSYTSNAQIGQAGFSGNDEFSFSSRIRPDLALDVGKGTGLDAHLGFSSDRFAGNAQANVDPTAFIASFTKLDEDNPYYASLNFGEDKKGGTLAAFYNGDNDYYTFGFVAAQTLSSATDHELKLSIGSVSEWGGALGSELGGLLETGVSSTAFGTVIGEYHVSPTLSLRGSYELAVTQFNTTDNSFITESGQLISDSMALGLVHHGLLGGDEEFSLTLSQPLAVIQGGTSLTTATAIDANGSYTFKTTDVDLAAQDRESRLTAAFTTKDWLGGKTEIGMALVHNADHVASDQLEVGTFLRFSKNW